MGPLAENKNGALPSKSGSVYILILICMYVCMYIYVYEGIYLCVCIYIHMVYLCMHIQCLCIYMRPSITVCYKCYKQKQLEKYCAVIMLCFFYNGPALLQFFFFCVCV